MNKEIPYKIYLEEEELPKAWMNLRAFMQKKPAPLLNPQTLKPMTLEDMSAVFCEELAKQVLLESEIEILITLGSGPYTATAWGCNLTYDYVKINGDYRT